MKTILRTLAHRFIWETPDKPWNMFLPFFMVLNVTIGLLFTIGSHLPDVNSLILFTVLDDFLPTNYGAIIWGSLLIMSFVIHLFAMYFRGRGIGRYSAMMGFLAWAYAMGIYLTMGSIFAALAICTPQLFFFACYWFGSTIYRQKLDIGLLRPVD